ncbi:MAG: nucleoside hydrolase [Lachnospiraceae bacterium]|nr:nucleoside hydrolase [Lachnospiraceae bacterium]
MRRNIILDCDPGIDDAVALAIAAAHREELKLLAITTVAGNQTIDRVTNNALKLVNFLGIKDVPVARGSAAPLIREVIPAEDVRGSTGLGDCLLPETGKAPASEQGVVFLADTILKLPQGETVTLVPTGPLTNIALLLKVFPQVKKRIDLICLMGGAAVGGNVTATGEFNIWQDPEAAQIVFHSGIPIVMCGLDVTNYCGFTETQIREMLENPNPVVHAYGEMTDFYLRSRPYCRGSIAAIHDAVTVTWLMHPEWFRGREMQVEVDCSEGQNRGMTVCDFREWAQPEKRSGVTVLLEADTEKIQKFWLEALYSYQN